MNPTRSFAHVARVASPLAPRRLWSLFRPMTSPTIPLSQLAPRTFLWSVDGPVGTITLNRPERKNPLTFESYAELTEHFRALVHVREIRAVVLTGAGGNFCSGGDVHEIIGPLVAARNEGRTDDLLRFTTMTGGLVKATETVSS